MAKRKNTVWIVKANTSSGWKEIARFDCFDHADEWLCSLVRRKGYWMSDFNIVKREV